MPTLEDQQQVSRWVDAKWKTRQRLRNSPRKEVEKLINDVDHTICGPPCEELPMPDCIRALNEEFAAIFPAKIPGGGASFEACGSSDRPCSRPQDTRTEAVQVVAGGGQGVAGAVEFVREAGLYRAICFTVWVGSAFCA